MIVSFNLSPLNDTINLAAQSAETQRFQNKTLSGISHTAFQLASLKIDLIQKSSSHALSSLDKI